MRPIVRPIRPIDLTTRCPLLLPPPPTLKPHIHKRDCSSPPARRSGTSTNTNKTSKIKRNTWTHQARARRQLARPHTTATRGREGDSAVSEGRPEGKQRLAVLGRWFLHLCRPAFPKCRSERVLDGRERTATRRCVGAFFHQVLKVCHQVPGSMPPRPKQGQITRKNCTCTCTFVQMHVPFCFKRFLK